MNSEHLSRGWADVPGYEAPAVETIEIAVEQGFAFSSDLPDLEWDDEADF